MSTSCAYRESISSSSSSSSTAAAAPSSLDLLANNLKGAKSGEAFRTLASLVDLTEQQQQQQQQQQQHQGEERHWAGILDANISSGLRKTNICLPLVCLLSGRFVDAWRAEDLWWGEDPQVSSSFGGQVPPTPPPLPGSEHADRLSSYLRGRGTTSPNCFAVLRVVDRVREIWRERWGLLRGGPGGDGGGPSAAAATTTALVDRVRSANDRLCVEIVELSTVVFSQLTSRRENSHCTRSSEVKSSACVCLARNLLEELLWFLGELRDDTSTRGGGGWWSRAAPPDGGGAPTASSSSSSSCLLVRSLARRRRTTAGGGGGGTAVHRSKYNNNKIHRRSNGSKDQPRLSTNQYTTTTTAAAAAAAANAAALGANALASGGTGLDSGCLIAAAGHGHERGRGTPAAPPPPPPPDRFRLPRERSRLHALPPPAGGGPQQGDRLLPGGSSGLSPGFAWRTCVRLRIPFSVAACSLFDHALRCSLCSDRTSDLIDQLRLLESLGFVPKFPGRRDAKSVSNRLHEIYSESGVYRRRPLPDGRPVVRSDSRGLRRSAPRSFESAMVESLFDRDAFRSREEMEKKRKKAEEKKRKKAEEKKRKRKRSGEGGGSVVEAGGGGGGGGSSSSGSSPSKFEGAIMDPLFAKLELSGLPEFMTERLATSLLRSMLHNARCASQNSSVFGTYVILWIVFEAGVYGPHDADLLGALVEVAKGIIRGGGGGKSKGGKSSKKLIRHSPFISTCLRIQACQSCSGTSLYNPGVASAASAVRSIACNDRVENEERLPHAPLLSGVVLRKALLDILSKCLTNCRKRGFLEEFVGIAESKMKDKRQRMVGKQAV